MQSNINPISFNAVKLSSTNIKKVCTDSKLKDLSVNLVQVMPNDEQALRLHFKNYNRSYYVKCIADRLNEANTTTYALTTQKQAFENLEPDKILGLTQVQVENNSMYIAYLATGTNSAYTQGKYKHIGKSLMQNVVKKAQDDKLDKISLCSLDESVQFYEKLGFIPSVDNWFHSNKYHYDEILSK